MDFHPRELRDSRGYQSARLVAFTTKSSSRSTAMHGAPPRASGRVSGKAMVQHCEPRSSGATTSQAMQKARHLVRRVTPGATACRTHTAVGIAARRAVNGALGLACGPSGRSFPSAGVLLSALASTSTRVAVRSGRSPRSGKAVASTVQASTTVR